MADNQSNPYSIPFDTSSPFAEYLQANGPQAAQTYAQPQQRPNGFEGKTGRAAFFVDQFIRGAQQGAYRKQQQELMKERASDNAVNQMIQILQTKDPQAAQPLMQQIMLAKGQQAMDFLDQGTKGKDKDQPGSHVLNALKSIGQGLLGGKVEKWKGYGDKMGEWTTAIANMPSKQDAQARDLGQFNGLVSQVSKQISDANGGRQPYYEELAANPAIKNAASQVSSLYGVDPRAEWKDTYTHSPYYGLSPEAAQAKQTSEKTEAVKQQAIGDIWKNVQLGGDKLPEGVTKEDIQAGLFRSEFGVVPQKTRVITVQDPENHKYQMAIEKTNPNTGSVTVEDRDGKALKGNWVPVTRVDQARPMQRFVSTVGGKRVWTFSDMSDPDNVKIVYPRDAKGNMITAPETGNRSETDKTIALTMTAYKDYMNRALSTNKARSQALNQVRNTLDYLGADPAKKQQMERDATKAYDNQLKELKPQLKAQLGLLQAIGGGGKNLINAAQDAGVLDKDDIDSVTEPEEPDNATPAPPSDIDWSKLRRAPPKQ